MNTNKENGYNTQPEATQSEVNSVNNTMIEDQSEATSLVTEQEDMIAATPEEEKKTGWREAVMSGTAGAAMGAAGALWISGVPFGEEYKQDTNGGDEHNNPTSNTNLPVAHNVNDDMSFSEAFAAARQEVGAGGVFVWHGGVYGTYYANEWNSMTPQQQSDFTHDAIGVPHTTVKHEPQEIADNGHDATSSDNNGDVIPDIPTDNGNDGEDVPVVISDNNDNGGNFGEAGTPEPMIVINGNAYDVEVLNALAGTDPNTGQTVYVGQGIVAGHGAEFVDETSDGVFDHVLIDLNDNGQLDGGDYAAPIQGGIGLDIETFADNLQSPEQVNPNDDMNLADNDYVNDGDVSQLV